MRFAAAIQDAESYENGLFSLCRCYRFPDPAALNEFCCDGIQVIEDDLNVHELMLTLQVHGNSIDGLQVAPPLPAAVGHDRDRTGHGAVVHRYKVSSTAPSAGELQEHDLAAQ